MSLLSTQYWVARAAMGADDDAENAPDGGGKSQNAAESICKTLADQLQTAAAATNDGSGTQ